MGAPKNNGLDKDENDNPNKLDNEKKFGPLQKKLTKNK